MSNSYRFRNVIMRKKNLYQQAAILTKSVRVRREAACAKAFAFYEKDFPNPERDVTQVKSDAPSVFRFRGEAAKLRAAPAKENAPAKELKSSAQRAD